MFYGTLCVCESIATGALLIFIPHTFPSKPLNPALNFCASEKPCFLNWESNSMACAIMSLLYKIRGRDRSRSRYRKPQVGRAIYNVTLTLTLTVPPVLVLQTLSLNPIFTPGKKIFIWQYW